MSWTTKHKPKSVKEFVNQKEAVETFLKWKKKWKPGDDALLFFGPPGTGKTSLLQAYANEHNIDFIEMNASDWRSAAQIQEVLGQSMLQTSLFRRSKLFLIDEVDGIAGREDLGGVGAIIKIIKETKFPVILTANNAYDQKLRSLREHCQLVQFKKIHVYDIEKKLKQICENEGIKPDETVLRELAKISSGDLRAAINDLEAISHGKEKITMEDLESLGNRERETSIFDVMKIIFKTENALSAKLSINNSDKDPEEIFWWIESNILNEYEKPEEIAKAFDMLSKADLFRSRIPSAENWRLKGYMIDMITGGVAVSKKEMYRKFSRYQYPSNIALLGRTKVDRKDMKELLSKLSKEFHCSSRKLKTHYLPFIKVMIKNKATRGQLASSFQLTKDEIDLLK